VILVDANLLIYAYDGASPFQARAARWLEDRLNGQEDVGFATVSLLAFVRICTSPRILEEPLPVDDAIAIVGEILRRPRAIVASPTDFHWSTMEELCRSGQAKGPLVMDAHVAALALEHGATLCTTDRDFARFPRLRFMNPLAA